MTSSPDPHARDHTGARPLGPVYGQEGAYATHPADAPVPGAVPPPPGPSAPPVGPDAPHAAPAPEVPVGDAQTGYAQPPHPQPGYPQPGYPQPGYPQPGYPQPGYPQPGYPVRPPLPRNDLAIWSLVLGLLGVLGCLFFTGIPAVVVGRNARRAVAAGEADNDGTATAGIVLGWVATGLGVVVGGLLVLSLLMPLLFMGVALPIMGYR